MKSTHELDQGNYYLFESLSSGNTRFFETGLEIQIFKKLIKRYLGKYIEIHRVFVDTNGYHMLVRIKQFRTIKSNYIKRCEQKGKEVCWDFLKFPWKIVSEMMRVFKSVYVKAVNKIRGREGVLVKHNYKKYYFESEAEYATYLKKMEEGDRIRSQRNRNYERGIRGKWTNKLHDFRARKESEVTVIKGFQDFVGRILINSTYLHHNPTTSPP